MSRTPFFSIVTPTYNRGRFLPEMIETVQKQSFADYEHIIIDDGSEDDSEKIVTAFAKADSRITYIIQENKGRSTARNVGIEQAKGQYVCFLDSDDLWLPNHLENLHQAIEKHNQPAFFHTGLIWFYDDDTPEQEVVYRPRHFYTSDTEFAVVNQFAPDCVCVPRASLEENKFNPTLSINEDAELWARISIDYPVVSIEESTAKLRVHSGNTSALVEDAITPMRQVFKLIIQNEKVRPKLSDAFIADRKRGFDELEIRNSEEKGTKLRTIGLIIKFLLKYPTNPRNSAKLVSLLYLLPGGSIIKRWKQG